MLRRFWILSLFVPAYLLSCSEGEDPSDAESGGPSSASGDGGSGGSIDRNTGNNQMGSGGTSTEGTGGAQLGSGGAGSGGAAAGSGGEGSGGPLPPPISLAEQYPCDGSAADYDVTVIRSGSVWTVQKGASTLHTGSDMKAAIEAGLGALTAGRTTQESLLVQGNGTMAASTRISLPNQTLLNVCGTIQVTGSGSGDNAPLYARDRQNISIPHVTVDGPAPYGLFFRNVNNLHLGEVVVRNTAGIGVRIDNHPSNGTYPKVQSVRIDSALVEDTGSQGVETYGVDGLNIGSITARRTGESGLLLNNTINAQIGLIDAVDAGTATGYAAFRMANRNGRYDDGSYPTNITVEELRAERGGRGFFCVSESGGVEVKRLQITAAGTDPAVFIEDCYNVHLASDQGSVTRGASSSTHRIRITARTSGGPGGGPQFLGYSDGVLIENLTINNSPVSEDPCGGDNTVRNNTRISSSLSLCPGTDGGGN